MEPKRKILIDTDTGSDDAVAIMMALFEEAVDVVGITTVCGNVPVCHATPNALMTVEVCAKSTPVYEGAAKPLFRALTTAVNVHGDDGMGDCGIIHPTTKPQPGHGVDCILRMAAEHTDELEIVALGPVTNLALAVMLNPDAMRGVKHIFIMGTTGLMRGNTKPVSSFNTYVDAESYHILFQSGIPLTIIGFDMCCGEARLNDADLQRLATAGVAGRFAVDCNKTLYQYNIRRLGLPVVDLPDPVAMAVALWGNEVAKEQQEVYCHCCYTEQATYGQVIYYMPGEVFSIDTPPPACNARLVTRIDAAAFKARLFAAFGA